MDQVVSAATFATANAVPAFPLGGRVAIVQVSGETPAGLPELADKTSVLMFRVPPGQTLYVGNAAQVGAAEGDDARALMIDFPAGHWPFSLVDADQADLVVLGGADFTLRILQAATLGQE